MLATLVRDSDYFEKHQDKIIKSAVSLLVRASIQTQHSLSNLIPMYSRFKKYPIPTEEIVWMQELSDRVRNEIGPPPFDLKKSPERHMPFLRTMLKDIQAHMDDGMKGCRVWSLLSQKQFKPIFININTTVLKELAKALGDPVELYVDKAELWHMYFNIGLVTKDQRKEFVYFISTDGMSVGVTIFRPKLSAREQKEAFSLEDRIIGFDPGRKKIFTTVVYKEESMATLQKPNGENVKHKAIHWSKGRFYRECGYHRRTKLTKEWIDAESDTKTFNENVPSAKVSDLISYLKRIGNCIYCVFGHCILMFTSILPEVAKPASPHPSFLRRQSSKRLSLTKSDRPSDRSTQNDRAAASSSQLEPLQRQKSSVRRISIQNITEKPDIPSHLLKFLQKTPEQQQRVNAVKAILVDSPGARNELSLDLVYGWMLHNCKQYSNNIFGAAPEYIRREICRQMRLVKVLSNELIIKQGDTGDRCYIVIDGIVDIYVKKKPRASIISIDEEEGEEKEASGFRGKKTKLKDDDGDLVNNLGPGAMFGEIVLLNPSARRNATIRASQYTESTELIFLERADYIRLVRTASMEASHYNHAEVLDQMYLFQRWEKHEKMRLVSAMRSLHFSSKEYLYRAGSEAKWMFIITSGEVVERINWDVAMVITTAATTTTTAGGSASLTASSNSGRLPTKRSGVPESKVNVELALIGAGDIAGELPFVASKRSAAFDIKAVTDVQTLAIDRRFYESVMLVATPETNAVMHTTIRQLKKLSQDREDWRQQRLACGAAYPDAHIRITWQLMRMSNFRCPRCGLRGHLSTDAVRCDNPLPQKPDKTEGDGASNGLKHLPPSLQSPKAALISSSAPNHSRQAEEQHRRRRPTALRELFDDNYLPTAKEQLQRCRNNQQQYTQPQQTQIQS